jgi:hypothetical protein
VRFKEYFYDLAAGYEPDVENNERPALETHEDLLRLIRALRTKPDIPRKAFSEEWFATQPNQVPIPEEDQDRAINLAVKIMVMINCSAQRQVSGLLEHGAFQKRWHNDATLTEFISDAFPETDHPVFNETEPGDGPRLKSALMAKKLKKVAGLKFKPTDDLRCHLKLDQKTGTVDIFHHTAFLKEQLRLTKHNPRPESVSESLKMLVNVPEYAQTPSPPVLLDSPNVY